jgi:RND family efflux transporter MFP subunit
MKLLRRAFKYLVLLAVLVGVAYGAWAAIRARFRAASPHEDTFQAQLSTMEDVLVVSGQVRPAVTIDLRAEASGIVEAVLVKEGDRVTQGQELVRLDSKLAQSSLDQAEANLRQAELQDAATKLDLDEDTVLLKKKTVERTTALFQRGLIPKDQLDQHELELRVSQRAFERAKRNIDGSQARIAQMQAAVAQAQTQLQHTTIRAPFDAFVLRRQVELGSGVAGVSQSSMGGTVLMTLGDARMSALYAKATASDARRLRVGQAARVRLDSDAAEVLPATVQSVSTAGDVDQSSKLTTFPVIIALKSQPPGGWVNVPAQAEIILSAAAPSVSVPERCVRADAWSGGRSYVVVQSKTGNTRFTVEVGVIQKDRIQIRSGLEQGQTVVCRAQ